MHGTEPSQQAPADPDLADLISRWPGLAQKTRNAILALAKHTTDAAVSDGPLR